MKNKYLVLILFCFLMINRTFAQEDVKNYDVGTLSLSLIMPDEVDELSTSHLSKLQNKILKMLTSNGLSGNGYRSNFVIFPKFEMLDKDEMTGMEKMVSVEIEVSLFVKQLDNNVMFSSYSKTVKGIASKEKQAIKNAIKKIPTRGKEVDDFLLEAKERILTYYRNKCNDIILEADRYSKTNDYEKAISTLLTIPSEVGECYTTAQGKAIEYYKAYSDQKCAEYIQKAKTAEAKQNYKNALTYLSLIDPSGNCKTESLDLIQRISGKVDQKEKKYWDFAMKRYEDQVSLEQSRIKAITEISEAYYNRTQPEYHVTYKSLY